jgi:DNA-binding CsgD family transcriptional regulator
MNARIARRVLEMFTRFAQVPADYGLTDRERSVLDLMIRGLIKKEIAVKLGLSIHTIDSHIRNIYEKLHVRTRSGAVAKAVKEKLVGP